jgi:hypothetical protein
LIVLPPDETVGVLAPLAAFSHSLLAGAFPRFWAKVTVVPVSTVPVQEAVDAAVVVMVHIVAEAPSEVPEIVRVRPESKVVCAFAVIWKSTPVYCL